MAEHQDLTKRDDHQKIRKQLDQVLLSTFCRALDSSYLTPMTILNAMAEALGSVYRQVADSHHTGECRCGWEPAELQDLERLQSALRDAAKLAPADTLSTMQTLGRA
jgi:hypothetical protein